MGLESRVKRLEQQGGDDRCGCIPGGMLVLCAGEDAPLRQCPDCGRDRVIVRIPVARELFNQV